MDNAERAQGNQTPGTGRYRPIAHISREPEIRTPLFCRHLVIPQFSDQVPSSPSLPLRSGSVDPPSIPGAMQPQYPVSRCAPSPRHPDPPKILFYQRIFTVGRAIFGTIFSATCRGAGASGKSGGASSAVVVALGVPSVPG